MKTIKNLEKNIRKTTLWPWVRQRFLDRLQKAQNLKGKNIYWSSSKFGKKGKGKGQVKEHV